jgi:hypothetical protein
VKSFPFVGLNDDAIFKALSCRLTDPENLPFPASWKINDVVAFISLGKIRKKLMVLKPQYLPACL